MRNVRVADCTIRFALQNEGGKTGSTGDSDSVSEDVDNLGRAMRRLARVEKDRPDKWLKFVPFIEASNRSENGFRDRGVGYIATAPKVVDLIDPNEPRSRFF